MAGGNSPNRHRRRAGADALGFGSAAMAGTLGQHTDSSAPGKWPGEAARVSRPGRGDGALSSKRGPRIVFDAAPAGARRNGSCGRTSDVLQPATVAGAGWLDFLPG